MQIKTTLRFHLTPVRMAKIKSSGDRRCWGGCGERGNLEISLAVPYKIGHSTTGENQITPLKNGAQN